MGGAAVVNILTNMVRVKFAAVFIGTIGVGLMSAFTSIQNILCVLTGFGIHSSSVREIAAANASKDEKKMGTTIIVLRRISIFAGFCGLIITTSFAAFISKIVFNETKYTFEITLLGLSIMLTIITNGQLALLQGMRLISFLAKAQIIGNIIGITAAVSFIYLYGVNGVLPSIIIISTTRLCTSWYYARKVDVPNVNISFIQTFKEAKSMVRLGFIFMWNSLLVSGVNIFTISLLNTKLSVESVGIYSASFTISSLAVGFILQAMSADYYPRIVSLKKDIYKINKVVNEQTEVAILISLTPLLTLFLFAPVVIKICYDDSFASSVELLRWFILGSFLKIVCWPLGFVLLAFGKDLLFYITETTSNVLNMILIYLFFEKKGLVGVAMASPVIPLFYAIIVFLVCKKLTKYNYNKSMIIVFFLALLLFLLSITNIFCSSDIYFLLSSLIIVLSLYTSASIIICRSFAVGKINNILSCIPFLPFFIKLFSTKFRCT